MTQTFHKEEDEEESSDEMDDDRADQSSNESSNEEDIQSEADQDTHLEKNEVFHQWLDTARDDARQ